MSPEHAGPDQASPDQASSAADPAARHTPRAGVIFDLDGLLVESEPYWREGFRAGVALMADELGAPRPQLSEEFLTRFEGGRVPDTLGRLAEELFPDTHAADLVPRAAEAAIARATELFGQDPRPIRASVETAHALAERGMPLAVASSSAEPFIRGALEAIGLAGVFTVVESAYELEHAKPHPQVYLNAIAGLGVDARVSVAVEDSKVGAESALRAGLRTLWASRDLTVELPVSLLEGEGGHGPRPPLIRTRDVRLSDIDALLER